MQYKLVNDSTGNQLAMIQKIEDDGTVRWIPQDEDNMDWRAYQEWLDLGNEPLPAD